MTGIFYKYLWFSSYLIVCSDFYECIRVWCKCIYACSQVQKPVCVYVCPHVCKHVYQPCIHGSTKLMTGVNLNCSPPYMLRQGLFLNRELTFLTSLARQFALWVPCLSSALGCPQAATCMQLLHGFYRVKLDSSSCKANSLSSEASLHSPVFSKLFISLLLTILCKRFY